MKVSGRFFEKICQKTFDMWAGGRCKIPCKELQKFFWFFFFKKRTAFFP